VATAHLVHGFLGAGKTTLARRLAVEHSAIRLSVDEWYLKLHADGPVYEWDAARGTRLLGALNEHWPALCARGIDVVLDFGFWRRALRDEVRALATSAGAATRLYALKCPDDVARARCIARNGTPGAFLISAQGYDALKTSFEPLAADEAFELADTSTSACAGAEST
jgi:predicted kinase